MAAGDITACRIASAAAHNGWVAEIDIEGLSDAGTYAFGFGANNNPATAKIVFTLTSPGYDTAGNATTIARTVYGTMFVRQASPNQALADETEAAGTLTVRVALSDFIYSGDTAIAVTIGAGFYTEAGADGGSASNAVSGLSVTNNSTLAYPKVIGRWAWPAFETVQSNFLLEAICFHRAVQNAKPVAAVTFTVTDGSATETVTVTSMTVSTRTGDVNKVLVYAATIPIASFAQGAVLTCNFVAYPWVGDSGSTLDSNSGVTPPDERLTPHLLLCDKNATYGGGCAVVDPVNGNNSTATTWIAATRAAAESAYATASSNSYTTIINAIQAIKSWNNTNLSRNNYGGGVVLLCAATHAIGTVADGGAMNTWLTVTRLSTVTRAQAILGSGSNQLPGVRRLKYTDITISGSVTGQVRGSTTLDAIWIHSCAINQTGSAGIYSALLFYATQNTVTAFSNGFQHFSTTKSPYGLIRGNTGPTTAAGAGIAAQLYCMVGNYNLRPIFVPTGNTYNQQISDNSICAFNTHYGLNTIWLTAGASSTSLSRGMAVVQNIIERVTGVSEAASIWGGLTSSATDHIIVWHNTIAGQRLNIGYNDVNATAYLQSNYSQRGNICDEWNNKDDVFAPADGGRTGAWPVGYNVGSVGNHRRSSSNGSGISYTDWIGEFAGLHCVNGGTLGFVDDNSFNNGGGGSATGNGDYHLNENASGYTLVPSGGAVLPYDIQGSQRSQTGGSAGAFEMVEVPQPVIDIEDLTTGFVAYVQDLRDASPLARLDTDTLIAQNEDDVRGEIGEDEDLTTAYAIYVTNN